MGQPASARDLAVTREIRIAEWNPAANDHPSSVLARILRC